MRNRCEGTIEPVCCCFSRQAHKKCKNPPGVFDVAVLAFITHLYCPSARGLQTLSSTNTPWQRGGKALFLSWFDFGCVLQALVPYPNNAGCYSSTRAREWSLILEPSLTLNPLRKDGRKRFGVRERLR